MANEASIRLSADVRDAIAKIQDLSRKLKDAGASASQADDLIKDFGKEAIAAFDAAAEEADKFSRGSVKSIAQAEKAMEAFSRAQRHAVSAEQRQNYALLSKESEALRNSLVRTGRGTVDVTGALTDFSRLVEDSAFGIRGMANNINPAVLSFQRLKSETGSTTGALRAMLQGMTGPAGLAIAISLISTLAITMGDKLSGAFGKGSDAAITLKEKAEELLNTIVKFESGLLGVDITPQNIQRVIGATEMQLGGRQELRQALQAGRLNTLDPASTHGLSLRAQKAIEEIVSKRREEGRLLVFNMELLNEEVALEQKNLEILEQQREAFEDQADLQRIMISRGADPIQQRVTGRDLQLAPRVINPLDLATGFTEDPTKAVQIRGNRPANGPIFGGSRGAEDPFDKMMSDLLRIQTMTSAGIIDPKQASQNQAQALRQGLEAMIATGIDPASEGFQHWVGLLRQSEAAAQDNTVQFQQIAEVGQQAVQVLTQLFQGQHTARMNQIAAERDAALDSIDRQLDRQSLTEKQRVDLLARRAKLERKYEDERKEAARDAAKREKITALFSIGIQTAQAVVEALPNVILAAVVGGLGAAQAAVVAAQPIPQFRRGGVMRKDGLAVVGEAGPELVRLPAGARVHPHEQSVRMLDRPSISGASIDYNRLGDAVAEALSRRPVTAEMNLFHEADKLNRYERRKAALGMRR